MTMISKVILNKTKILISQTMKVESMIQTQTSKTAKMTRAVSMLVKMMNRVHLDRSSF